MATPIILDTDPGNDIDDFYALALAVRHPGLELRAVTTSRSYPQSRARLAAKYLRLAGHDSIPVLAGAGNPPPGRGGTRRPAMSRDPRTHTSIVQPDDPEWGKHYPDAVDFILTHLDESDAKVTLVGIGPWTNIADVLTRATPAQLDKIGLIAIMGGEVHLVRRESNASFDPVATQTVLDAEVPLFVATWSPSRTVSFAMAEIEQLFDGVRGDDLRMIRDATRTWHRPGSIKPGPVLYDVVPLFWAAGEREAITSIRLYGISVEMHGQQTSGMTVCEPWTIESAEVTTTTSPDYTTVTSRVDGETLKRRYAEIVLSDV